MTTHILIHAIYFILGAISGATLISALVLGANVDRKQDAEYDRILRTQGNSPRRK